MLRHRVALATLADIASIAATMESQEAPQAVDLMRTVNVSTQVWAARDSSGDPSVIWGVRPSPKEGDGEVGYFWMLATEDMDGHAGELAMLTQLVVAEMLEEFTQLENDVDASKVRAIALLKEIGFQVEPEKFDPVREKSFCRVWIDSARASMSFVETSNSAPN